MTIHVCTSILGRVTTKHENHKDTLYTSRSHSSDVGDTHTCTVHTMSETILKLRSAFPAHTSWPALKFSPPPSIPHNEYRYTRMYTYNVHTIPPFQPPPLTPYPNLPLTPISPLLQALLLFTPSLTLTTIPPKVLATTWRWSLVQMGSHSEYKYSCLKSRPSRNQLQRAGDRYGIYGPD